MFTTLRARFTQRIARSLLLAGVAGLALGTAACTNDGSSGLSTAPTIAVRAGVLPANDVEVSGLLWQRPVTEQTASAVIGAKGGMLRLPSGMRLIVPAGAVASDVKFSVTRLAGSIVAYDFEPHGIKFAVPLVLEQPIDGTNFASWPSNANVRGAYFADRIKLDQARGKAKVSEFRASFLSSDKKWIRFSIEHFSGYMVSMD